jgi:hypothetical protein
MFGGGFSRRTTAVKGRCTSRAPADDRKPLVFNDFR